MRMRCFVILLLAFSYSLGTAGVAQGQQSTNEVARTIVRRTDPRYPDIARRMNIAGTVKVFVNVAPDGRVKSVDPAGGHPLLIEAARQAILEWRFAPGTETRELIELHFNPQGR